MAERLKPIPPPMLLLQQLVDAGYVASATTPLTTSSILVLTAIGEEALKKGIDAGWTTCRITVTKGLPETDVLAFLRAVELGEVTLTSAVEPAEATVIRYAASNGWEIAVFNDANEWDYIEWIQTPDHRIEYEDIEQLMPKVAAYEPAPEVAWDAYGIPGYMKRAPGTWRGFTGSPRARSADLCDERAFERVLRLLRGGERLQFDGCTSKMLRILFGGDTDSLLTARRFDVHIGMRYRKPFTYYRRLAPGAVSEILTRAELQNVSTPVVIGLPGASVADVRNFGSWSYDPKLIWIVPISTEMQMSVRSSPERWRQPFVGAIPDEGPLALRPLPEWHPPAPRWRELDETLRCPNCGVEAKRYRELTDALVCCACARSFRLARPWARVVPGA